jgi:hypothetical protein
MVCVTISTRPAVIDYAEIREAVTVEPDDCMSEAPWDNCDGYEHELRPINSPEEGDSEASFHHDGRRQIVVVSTDHGIYDYLRARGCSKQVAREAVASDRRRTIEQLQKWYRDGWEWWQVDCEFMGESDGVGGVDDFDYANGACADDIAENVAHALEEKGYTVTNRPDRRAGYLENRRYHLRQNLLIGTWRS